MSRTVAGILVDVLEKIGVTHIFGLIADSLNPIGDAVRHSKIEWIGVRHEEGGALAAAGQAKLTGRLGVFAGQPDPAAPISSPASMRQIATTRRFLRSPAICRASWKESTIFKRQIPTCCSAMCRFIPRLLLYQHRRRNSFIRLYAGRGVAQLDPSKCPSGKRV
jgi:Thiamine pyrophosphate enzyme, N-terminal TPP binding domain